MSDDIKHEQPAHGGSYTRQPDGSLVRNPPTVDAAMSQEAAAAPHTKSKKGK